MNVSRIIALSSLILLAGCTATAPTPDQPPVAKAPLESGLDIESLDTRVRPQDDFFEWVNGSWLEATEIPADKSNYGAFTELFDAAEANLRQIIEEAAATAAPPGSVEQKVGDMYRSFMDVERIERLGLQPLTPEFERIAAIGDKDDLAHWFGNALRLGVSGPLFFWINQDARATTEYISYLNQGGLGLPDRDYYFDESERFQQIRSAYLDYIANILELAGSDAARVEAKRIFALEQRIAEAHWTRVENRDRNATYNKYSIEKLQADMPQFDWLRFLDGAGLSDVNALIVRQPSYFDALDDIVADVPLSTWKSYLRFRLLNAFAPDLPQAFVDANFDFYGRTLRGTEKNRERWKRAVARVEAALGEAVGQIYVERHFQPAAKERMDDMVENLRMAFAEAINELEWMGPETQAEAQQKLAKFTPKIGYPNQWRDYTSLEIRPDSLIANQIASARFEHQRNVDKLGKPIDRDEWFMTPQTVNAYYNPSMNEIVFPAAILQPPFFNVAADDAVNYGAIGAVIGHEFSHGFDDQGRKSDGDGTLRDWWTEQDAEEFRRRSSDLVAQYNEFSPIEGMNVNGELTLGENIGDLAGLTMAYRAYKLSLGGREAPVIGGYTGDQRFFMGWSQVWRRKYREDELRRRLVTDPHSPSRYRV
ncbi:MAG: M13 family metallopeptidase, partial [Gammaproteobacteria bacterium]|nr:M13 family metallopeptidase [Gammaproteobacteria bacterium]